jgi:hypothetical protein
MLLRVTNLKLKIKNYKLKMKKLQNISIFFLSLIITLFSSFSLSLISAQDGSADLDSIIPEDAASNVGLEEISIPFFKQAFDFDTKYGTFLSWLGFFASAYTIAIVIFWIIYILRATVNAVRSSGEAEKLANSYTQIKSVLIAAGLSILFPVALSLIGIVIGAGSIFQWPKAFRSCPGDNGRDPDYEYYFQAFLNVEQDDVDVYCGL